MAIIVLCKIVIIDLYKGKTIETPIGYRLADTDTRGVKDVSMEQVEKAIEKGMVIVNARLAKSKDKRTVALLSDYGTAKFARCRSYDDIGSKPPYDDIAVIQIDDKNCLCMGVTGICSVMELSKLKETTANIINKYKGKLLGVTKKESVRTDAEEKLLKYINNSNTLGLGNEFKISNVDGKMILDKYIGNSKVVKIPDFIDVIGDEAFYRNNVANKVYVGSNVKEIRGNAFCHSQVEKIQLEEGLETIGYQAFGGTKIKDITIPSTVRKLESSLFDGCEELNEINIMCNNIDINSCSDSIFYGISGCKVNMTQHFIKSLIIIRAGGARIKNGEKIQSITEIDIIG